MSGYIVYCGIIVLAYVVGNLIGFNTGWSKCNKRIREIVKEAMDECQ